MRRFTGVCALARDFFAIRNVVFTTILLGLAIYVTMLVFAVGLRELIRRADAECEWALRSSPMSLHSCGSWWSASS